MMKRALLAGVMMLAAPFMARAAEIDTMRLVDKTALIEPARRLAAKDRKRLLCLALAIYQEARSEDMPGRRAVAHVVLNRTRADAFPKTVCGVVWQRHQFSWTGRRARTLVPTDPDAWADAQQVAWNLLFESDADPTQGALYFHMASVRPAWSNGLKRRLGSHVFVKPAAVVPGTRSTPRQNPPGR